MWRKQSGGKDVPCVRWTTPMHTLKLARSAIWPLILGCGIGTGLPAAADPGTESPTARDAAASPGSVNGVGSQFELAFWQSVSSSEDREQLEAYLAQYPNGTFSGLARAKIAALDRRGAGSVADNGLAATAVPAIVTVAPSRPDRAGDDSPAATGLPGATASGPSVPAAAAAAPAEAVKPALTPPAATPSPSAPAPGQSLPPSLAEQLRALGQSQGRRPEAPPSAPITQCVQSS